MTTVGIATGAGRGMGLACAQRLADLVDVVLLVDLEAATVAAAAERINNERHRATAESMVLDITDATGLVRLGDRIAELGTLRAVAHAAGISPSMADWRRIFTVDLIGTALLTQALRPLAGPGTAMVCFASMAPFLEPGIPDPAALAVLDDPLDEKFLHRIHKALGPRIEDPGIAYTWAKRGVHRFVRHEAVRLGSAGARICSVSPGHIDTPQGRQEEESHPLIERLIQRTPLGRKGKAEEVAAAVAFLLSDDAGFVNGIDLLVDGGVGATMWGAEAS